MKCLTNAVPNDFGGYACQGWVALMALCCGNAHHPTHMAQGKRWEAPPEKNPFNDIVGAPCWPPWVLPLWWPALVTLLLREGSCSSIPSPQLSSSHEQSNQPEASDNSAELDGAGWCWMALESARSCWIWEPGFFCYNTAGCGLAQSPGPGLRRRLAEACLWVPRPSAGTSLVQFSWPLLCPLFPDVSLCSTPDLKGAIISLRSGSPYSACSELLLCIRWCWWVGNTWTNIGTNDVKIEINSKQWHRSTS